VVKYFSRNPSLPKNEKIILSKIIEQDKMFNSDLQDSEVAKRLFAIKKNQLKMVEARGYSIEREKHLLQTSFTDFLNSYVPYAEQNNKTLREVLMNVYPNDQGTNLMVYYVDPSEKTTQVGTENVANAIKTFDQYKVRNGILIIPTRLSPPARKWLKTLVSYNIQVFKEDEMTYNPTEHVLVPKHTVLSLEEATRFLSENKLDFDKLPVMRSNDIIARYYGMRSGDIVKIERYNLYETLVDNSLTYRAVKDEQHK
jgi:DNA-directed RNA polymerase I, II, and III subunit RPABC1